MSAVKPYQLYRRIRATIWCLNAAVKPHVLYVPYGGISPTFFPYWYMHPNTELVSTDITSVANRLQALYINGCALHEQLIGVAGLNTFELHKVLEVYDLGPLCHVVDDIYDAADIVDRILHRKVTLFKAEAPETNYE